MAATVLCACNENSPSNTPSSGGTQPSGNTNSGNSDVVKKVFIKGAELIKVPSYNKYDGVSISDASETWGAAIVDNTKITSASMLPFNMYLDKGYYIEMEGLSDQSYYIVEVYYSKEWNGEGIKCMRTTLRTSDILKYPGEHLLKSSSGDMQLYLIMKYE